MEEETQAEGVKHYQSRQERSLPLGFKALLVTEFFSAFNDHLLKQSLALLLIAQMLANGGGESQTALLNLVFFLPFVLFSTYGGFLADYFAKSQVIRLTKASEVIVAALAAYGLIAHKPWIVVVALFFMGLKSALFSPAKYSVLPELVEVDDLSRANGHLECWTFVAIIAGTVFSGALAGGLGGQIPAPSIAILVVACLGFISTFVIPDTARQNERTSWQSNPLEALKTLGEIRRNRTLFLVALGMSFFWFLGAISQFNLLLYAKVLAGWSDMQASYLAAFMGIGVAFGSLFAGRVSEGKVELGLVPIGALGIAILLALLRFTTGSFLITSLAVFGIGFSSGMYYVPLSAYFVRESPLATRGKYVAATNVLSFSAMMVSSLLHYASLQWLQFNAAHVFLLLSVFCLAITIYACFLMPNLCLRAVNWMVAHLLYRLQVRHRQNLPRTGGALLVCNHVSYADACLLLAASERPIRFLIYKPIYDYPLIKPMAKLAGAIPVAAEANPKELLRAIRTANDAVRNGELVCIFAEGSLTRLGNLLPFSRGLERIMRGLDAPIIPVHLDQLWGSVFSFRGGRFFWKMPRSLPYPVTVSFGEHLPADSPTYRVRQAVWELSSEAFSYREKCYQLLHASFLQTAKRKLFAQAVSDSTGKTFSYIGLLTACLIMRKRIARELGPEEQNVGLALPASAGGVLANLSLFFANRTPININFTSGLQSLQSIVEQCGMKTVLTSEKILSRFAFPQGVRAICIEDLAEGVSKYERYSNFLFALLLPRFVLERLLIKRRASENDLATIIFSSGSSGEPKGVCLSHRNISSNLQSLHDVFQLSNRDCIVGVLPFFHSFGFTGTIWLPILSGARACYHPNPLEAEAIGKLVQKEKGTILLATPSFLSGYVRKCEAEQFASLRLVVTGAEKLRESVTESFVAKFGVVPLEGYGATELSPVASLNLPNFEVNGMIQIGHKPGSVGHPLPGVAVRVLNPDTWEILPPNSPGLLLVKGENVMAGYLNDPGRTNEVMADGWYITGDIAAVDEDGFITIVDRLSRFSKIAGEMVPHGQIEAEIQRILGAVEQVCAVTAVPDEKRGERLIVFHSTELDVRDLLERLSGAGLPNLWLPKTESFIKIDALPFLGSGKVDLRTLKKMARERFS